MIALLDFGRTRIAATQGRTATGLAATLVRASLFSCAILLVGCGTLSGGGSGTRSGSQESADVPQKRGGYYLDDGPGPNPPANLDEIPDAVPRIEPLHRGTARPYSVMGRSYTPMTTLTPYRERGVATWYGRRYHGKTTSSGEVYDMYAMTAAHTVLPIPSFVRVTNLANGRSVVVRVNDRGPFVDERLIDLSYAAAHKLGMVRGGSALVEVESVLPGTETARQSVITEADRVPPPPVAAIQSETRTTPSVEPGSRGPVSQGEHYLQLGAFAIRANAERFLDEVRARLGATDAGLGITATGNLFRVHAGPYGSRADASQAAERIAPLLGSDPVITGRR